MNRNIKIKKRIHWKSLQFYYFVFIPISYVGCNVTTEQSLKMINTIVKHIQETLSTKTLLGHTLHANASWFYCCG